MATVTAKNISGVDIVLKDLSVPDTILPRNGDSVDLTQWNTLNEIENSVELSELFGLDKVQLQIDGVKLSNGGDLFNPPAVTVFGTYVNTAQDSREHYTSNTDRITMLKLPVDGVNGVYIVQWYVEGLGKTYRYGPVLNIAASNDAFDKTVRVSAVDKYTWFTASGFELMELSDPPVTVTLYYASPRRGKTVGARAAKIACWRIS